MGTALYLFANLAIFYVMYWAWKKDEAMEESDNESKPRNKRNR